MWFDIKLYQNNYWNDWKICPKMAILAILAIFWGFAIIKNGIVIGDQKSALHNAN